MNLTQHCEKEERGLFGEPASAAVGVSLKQLIESSSKLSLVTDCILNVQPTLRAELLVAFGAAAAQ